MRLVKVVDLVAGQTLASDVRNLHGRVVMPAGTEMDRRHLLILKAWGIDEVEIREDSPQAASAPESATSADVDSETREFWSGHDLGHPVLAEMASLAARLAPNRRRIELARAAGAPSSAGTPARPDPASVWPPVSAQTVASRVGPLASLPTTYFEVDRVVNSPSSSVADIARTVQNDQALSARLLRIANSAFYGFPRRVEGIAEAIQVIGTRQLHDLVLATLVLTQFREVDPRLVNMTSFWQHSLACGIAARSLATLRRESNTERFFVGGLLHDIGSLVLYQSFAERSQAALDRHRRSELSLEESERAVVGCDHGAVGAALMAMWRLPEFFRDIAANHHVVGHRQSTGGIAVVHVADLLVLALRLGSNGEQRLPRFSAEAWSSLGLPPAVLGQVAEDVLALTSEAQHLFFDQGGAA